MPSDLNRLRSDLSERVLQLSRLDVVEAAELSVRQELQRATGTVLDELNAELTLAKEQLARTSSTDDLARIADAEKQVCAIKRQLTAVERQARVQDKRIQRQRNVYLAARNAELRHIRGMERLIGRIESQPHL